MRHIFIDLEFCTCFRKSSPLRTETIEIGAVKLDENSRLIDEFDRLVRPDFARSIPSTERNLTGISWNMVENESSFTDVFYDFMKWVGDGEYLIYSWSTNDPIQCLRESKVKGFPIVESGMMKRWIDSGKPIPTATKKPPGRSRRSMTCFRSSRATNPFVGALQRRAKWVNRQKTISRKQVSVLRLGGELAAISAAISSVFGVHSRACRAGRAWLSA